LPLPKYFILEVKIPPSPPPKITLYHRRSLRHRRIACRRKLFLEDQLWQPEYWQSNFIEALPTPPPKKKMRVLNFEEF